MKKERETRKNTSRGTHCEQLAVDFLARRGLEILDRNWRCPGGEIDIICRDKDTIAFVEVRARDRKAGYLPEDTIGQEKVHRLMQTAENYLAAKSITATCRFDVVAIEMSSAGYLIRHIEDAFTGW